MRGKAGDIPIEYLEALTTFERAQYQLLRSKKINHEAEIKLMQKQLRRLYDKGRSRVRRQNGDQ